VQPIDRYQCGRHAQRPVERPAAGCGHLRAAMIFVRNPTGVSHDVFTGNLLEEVEIGGRPAVVPTIGGQAWIYGFSNFVLDPTDPFDNGFTVGDLWG
jgi:proline racemase